MKETGKQGKASFYGRKAALSESLVSEEPSTGLIKWQEKSCSEPPWEEVMLSGSAQPIRAWGMGRFPCKEMLALQPLGQHFVAGLSLTGVTFFSAETLRDSGEFRKEQPFLCAQPSFSIFLAHHSNIQIRVQQNVEPMLIGVPRKKVFFHQTKIPGLKKIITAGLLRAFSLTRGLQKKWFSTIFDQRILFLEGHIFRVPWNPVLKM